MTKDKYATPTQSRSGMRRHQEVLQGSSGTLKSVVNHAQQLLAIQEIIQQFVPPEVQVASVHDETLLVVTPSNTIATQIRYRQRNIIAAIRQHASGLSITDIKVTVRPLKVRKTTEIVREPRPLSAQNATDITATAKYIEHDPLRKALIALSEHARGTPKAD